MLKYILITSATTAALAALVVLRLVPAGAFKTDDLVVSHQAQVGPTPPAPQNQAFFEDLTNATTTSQVQIQEDDTSHVGSGENEAINLVLRQNAGFDVTSTSAVAEGLDVAVTSTKSSGTMQLSTDGPAVTGIVDLLGGAGSTINIIGTATISGPTSVGTSGGTNQFSVKGDEQISGPNADVWLQLANSASGGNTFYFESSASAGTQPNTLNIFDNAAGAVRWDIDSSGDMNVINIGGSTQIGLMQTGAIQALGSRPSLSGCGTTGATITGGAYSGTINTTAGATSCALAFTAGSLTGTPSVIIIDDAGGSPPITAKSVGGFTFTATAGHSYEFDARGH